MSDAATAGRDAASFGTTIFNVSWMAILLGLVIQLLIVAVQALYGAQSALPPILAELTQKVSWSFLVCAGLASGTAASRARGFAMGLAGLLAAPLAFGVARSLHKSAQQAMNIAGSASAASPAALAALKAVEYACLGLLLARLSKRPDAGARAYALTGLLVGVVFGGGIVGFIARAASGAGRPLSAAALASLMVNEFLFPVGCSLVIFSAGYLGRRAALQPAADEPRAS